MYREPAAMPVDEATLARLEEQRRGLRRARLVLFALAIVVPLFFFYFFERQARRLDALADHGVRADAIVTSPATSPATHYAYEVDGTTHHWNVARSEAPLAEGDALPVRYLPERPSFSRPGKTGDGAAREAAQNRAFYPRILLGFAGFFGLFGVVAHVRLGRLARGPAPPVRVDPKVLSWALALVMLLVVLGVNADPAVRAIHVAVVGAHPFGAPAWLVVSLVEVVLFFPFVPALEHLVRIAGAAIEDGATVLPLGLLVYAARIGEARPELVRSRAIAGIGLVYFVVLVSAWIAYANARGI